MKKLTNDVEVMNTKNYYVYFANLLADYHKTLTGLGLDITTEDVMKMARGGSLESLFMIKYADYLENGGHELDKQDRVNKVKLKVKEAYTHMPDVPLRKYNAIIDRVPADQWTEKNGKYLIPGIDKMIHQAHTITLTPDQEELIKRLDEFKAKYTDLKAFLLSKGKYYPDIFKGGKMPYFNFSGVIKVDQIRLF